MLGVALHAMCPASKPWIVITIATNDAAPPGPRAPLIVMVLVAGWPTPWQRMTLI